MYIIYSPLSSEIRQEVSIKGEVITVNGESFDFSPLEEGATLPFLAVKSEWFFDPIERIDGELHIGFRNTWGPNAPESTRFPQPVRVTQDGVLELPLYDEEVTDEQHRLVADDHQTDESSDSSGPQAD